MTVASTVSKVSYSGNGSTTAFSVPFYFLATSHLKVIVRSAAGTESVKVLSTDYTVTGAGNPAGGTVTLTVAPASGETLVIARSVPLTQAVDYQANDPFPAQTHENALDQLTMEVQQLQEQIDRSIKLSATNTINSTEFTVGASVRANKVLAFDSNGELSVTQELGTYRGNWAASTVYRQRDIIKDTSNNNIYLCLVAHTSTGAQPILSNADVAKWALLVDAASAASSASAAAASASAAATSATNAASSASSAATSSTNAANSASSASTSATNAASSASTASTAATNASNSAVAAANSAAAAAAAAASGLYRQVLDKTVSYTVVSADQGTLFRINTSGGAVTVTLPQISTVTDGFKVSVVKWTGDTNAVTIARSGSDTINGASSVTIGSQYTQTTFVADFETNQWFAATSGLGSTNVNVDVFNGNGSTTVFTLSGDPGSKNNTFVHVSGVYQNKNTYSQSGATITFSAAPPAGTGNIEIVWTQPLAVGVPSDGTVSTAKIIDGSVTPSKLSTGGPTWDASGALTLLNTYGTSNPAFVIQNNSTFNANNIARIDFKLTNSFGGGERSAAIWALNPNAAANNGGALVFGVSPNGTATTPNEAARIDSRGTFGVNVVPYAWSGQTAIQFGVDGSVSSRSNTADVMMNAYFSGSNYNYGRSFFASLYQQQDGKHRWSVAPSGTAGGAITFTTIAEFGTNGQQSSVIPGGTTLYPEYKCRAWVNFDGTLTGTITPRASGNVSSVTKNGTGDYTVNFTSAMPDGNYAWAGSAQLTTSANNTWLVGDPGSNTPSTSALRFKVAQGNFTNVDVQIVTVAVFR